MSIHQNRSGGASSMSHKPQAAPYPAPPTDNEYNNALHRLQIELVKLQKHIIAHGERILVIFEGRDAGGKDGTIKRIVEHLSPRETRVAALGKPSDREASAWYFQRYVPYLPVAEEMVLFNRSWYNRAGVERVMGFCSEKEHEEFLETVTTFEQMLIRSGITLIKYYLDISKHEQEKRLEDRRKDPLKQWKTSPIDAAGEVHAGAGVEPRAASLSGPGAAGGERCLPALAPRAGAAPGGGGAGQRGVLRFLRAGGGADGPRAPPLALRARTRPRLCGGGGVPVAHQHPRLRGASHHRGLRRRAPTLHDRPRAGPGAGDPPPRRAHRAPRHQPPDRGARSHPPSHRDEGFGDAGGAARSQPGESVLRLVSAACGGRDGGLGHAPGGGDGARAAGGLRGGGAGAVAPNHRPALRHATLPPAHHGSGEAADAGAPDLRRRDRGRADARAHAPWLHRLGGRGERGRLRPTGGGGARTGAGGGSAFLRHRGGEPPAQQRPRGGGRRGGGDGHP